MTSHGCGWTPGWCWRRSRPTGDVLRRPAICTTGSARTFLRSGDREREAVLCVVAASVHAHAGDFAAAEAALETFRQLAEGHLQQRVYALVNLGHLYRLSGQTVRAREQLTEARDDARGLGAAAVIAEATWGLAAVLAERDEVDAAAAELAAAEGLGADRCRSGWRGVTWRLRGRERRTEEAAAWWEQALAIRTRSPPSRSSRSERQADLRHLTDNLNQCRT